MSRASSGIAGLDKMIGGGFIRGDAVLVAGSPGTGKTTTGLHFMAAGIEAGENCVYVTFEYLPQQIYRDAAARGWDVKQWEADGKVRLICTSPEVLIAALDGGRTFLEDAVADIGAKRLVIDSMTHFEFLGQNEADLRQDLSGLMNMLRLLDVTSIVTHEIAEISGPAVRVSNWGLEFLVDAVILLRYVELEGELQKAVNVLKFRGGDHDRHFRKLMLTNAGVEVADAFEGVENISSGTARRAFAQRAKGLI